jgi:hypothetical protein
MKYLDTYGRGIDLYWKEVDSYKTHVGGFFSIITTMLSVAAFALFGSDLLYHQKPDYFVTQDLIQTPLISGKDLIFAISLVHTSGLPIVDFDKKFGVVFKYTWDDAQNTTNSGEEIVNLVKCTQTNFVKQNQFDILSQNLTTMDSFYCLPDDWNKDISGQESNVKVAYQYTIA